ncbi:ABC transporter family substrate-binding protein [Streptomyces sp. 4N509B]|uniref:ABC transporter family substrate-binding protein n=1 Tax=Streptomyces sp. 4N509B TaxID=3457413 RepID=UPI003FD4D700
MAAMLGGALVLSACGGSDDDEEGGNDTTNASDTITLAEAQPFQSYNNTTAAANSSMNSTVMNWVHSGFWNFGNGDGSIVPNEEFGTYEKTSDDPLTVEYTLHADAAWSDGEAIDCDDILLWWTQQSGAMEGLFSAVGTQGVEDTAMPECEAGGKEFSLVYDQPFADWESTSPGHGNTAIMPAHVVAEQGGLTPEEFLTALQEQDADALADAAAFFNEGWVITGQLPDPALIPSSGPYMLTDFREGESVTLTRNENYWGTPAATETIVIRTIPEEEQVQALQNGEVDVIHPQPTVDMAQQIEQATGATISSEVGNQYTYEHLDFNFNDGPFADNPRLREAFALCVPRQQIVDNLIKPVVPDAEVKNIRNVAPWDAGYEDVNAAVADVVAEYGTQDLERSRQILEEEDAVGTTIRLETLNLQRRVDTGNLIKAACDEAGFNVEFEAADDFFDTEGGLAQNTFDVAMFAWIGSSQVSGWNSTYRSVEECSAEGKGNNNGCYNNPEMDELLDQVVRTSDPAEVNDLIGQIELLAWEDLVTIPLFQHPGITAWNSAVQNVVPDPSQTGVVWNMPEWSKG